MDLNADLGELEGPRGRASDRALLGVVTTTHVACGAHAGDADTMRRTVSAAAEAGVVVGAHPSYPDREGFGRRELARPAWAVRGDVLSQLEALGAACAAEGVPLRSVKAHGALYNVMARDPATARAVAGAVAEFDCCLVLVVPPACVAALVATAEGLATVAEGFCDRAYLADGSLAARTVPGSVFDDPRAAADQAVGMAVQGHVTAVDGTVLGVDCATLCVHGDGPGALEVASAVRRALEAAGTSVAPFVRPPR